MEHEKQREKLIELIVNAKRAAPETGSFTEFLADFLLGYGVFVPHDDYDLDRLRELVEGSKKFAEYENTGLSPQEIEQLKGEAFGLKVDRQELEQYRFLGPIDRLRALVEAEQDGRCVVLPSGEHTDKDGENALKSAMNICFYHNNAVTRYTADAVAEKLTREAADVVPVVRCRECKRWKPGDFMGGEDIDHMYRGGKCPTRRFAVYENDFCSEGKRR